jgi:phosphonate transport system substrate-binding protein
MLKHAITTIAWLAGAGFVASVGVFIAAPAIAAPAAPANGAADRGAAKVTRAETLIIARISNDPRKQLKKIRYLGKYLTARLSDVGIKKIRGIVVPNKRRLQMLLRQGKADIFSESPLTSLWLRDHAGSKPFLREWKNNVASYHSVFMARRDSGIKSFGDLLGKVIAFEDEGSTSGFLLPYAVLTRAGFKLVKLDSPRAPVPAGTIGYAFAQGELNIVTWVHRKWVAVGSFANTDWQDVRRSPGPIKNDLIVFSKTPPLLRSIMNVRKDLNQRVQDKVRTLLLKIHKDSAGKIAAKKYNKITKFELIGEESAEAIKEAEQISRLLSSAGF